MLQGLDASGKDVPRNPVGSRVSIADFDWTATGNAAVDGVANLPGPGAAGLNGALQLH